MKARNASDQDGLQKEMTDIGELIRTGNKKDEVYRLRFELGNQKSLLLIAGPHIYHCDLLGRASTQVVRLAVVNYLRTFFREETAHLKDEDILTTYFHDMSRSKLLRNAGPGFFSGKENLNLDMRTFSWDEAEKTLDLARQDRELAPRTPAV